MFEKEAEEYAKSKKIKDDCIRFYDTKKHFKDGAEFGYNKAKEDADKMKRQFLELCNLKDMRIAELEKANEWHFVKDELPELYKDVLVVFPRGDCDVKRLTNHNEWVGRGSWCSLTDVIAWKEIVLPEIKEIE